jgi:hypothetical protein
MILNNKTYGRLLKAVQNSFRTSSFLRVRSLDVKRNVTGRLEDAEMLNSVPQVALRYHKRREDV